MHKASLVFPQGTMVLFFCVVWGSLISGDFADANSPSDSAWHRAQAEKSLTELKTYVPIATLSGMDKIVQADLTNLLQRHGIDSYCLGSVWYELYVPPVKKEEASKLIASEAKRGLFNPLYKYKDGKFIGLSESDLLYSDSMKGRPALLEAIFKCEDIRSHFAGLTHVKSLYAKKKLIWVTPDRQADAYDGSITLTSQNGSGCRVEFQMWDHGNSGQVVGEGSW